MMYFLTKVGEYSTPSGVSGVTTLNNIMTGLGTAIGVIVCIVGLIKLIMALADQNAASKETSSLMIGVGIFFVSLSQIIKILDIENSAKTANGGLAIAEKIIKMLGNMVTWAGAVLGVVSIVMLVMSIASEQADQKAEATKLMGVAIGMLSITSITSSISLTGTAYDGASIIKLVIGFVANIATYIGGGMAILAVWHFVHGIREEDPKEKYVAIRFAMAAIGLLSITGVLASFGFGMFGGGGGGGSSLGGTGGGTGPSFNTNALH